jgi:sulfide:quinone oxidoreductase
VGARLLRRRPELEVVILEPSEKHYYQPGWTMVGGGVFRLEDTVRQQKGLIPRGARWIKDAAAQFLPDKNKVLTSDGQEIEYDFLVVACGIQINWDEVKGLRESLGKNGVCSIYSAETAPYTWQCISQFHAGRAVFTQPATAIKCGAAPQKIMYLAADNFRRRGILQEVEVSFYTGKPGLLRVPEINEALMKIAQRYGIHLHFQANLREVNCHERFAIVETKTEQGQKTLTVPFDMLHVCPPMSAPDVIRNSPLALKDDPQGWVDVDPQTMQHRRYPNVFSLGDVAALGDTKTGAAVRLQAPVLVRNLIDVIEGRPPSARYNGYTACPVITGYGRLLLAEFDLNNKLTPTFPFLDPKKEHYSYWLLMRHLMPYLYWNMILKGRL